MSGEGFAGWMEQKKGGAYRAYGPDSTAQAARIAVAIGRRPDELEGVADAELEDDGLFVFLGGKREAPFKTQKPHGGHPAETEAHGGAHDGILFLVGVREPVDFEGEILILVVCVAHVEENDAGDVHGFEDGDFEFGVEHDFLVSTDFKVGEGGGWVGEIGGERARGAEGGTVESADGVGAADEEALEDGDFLARGVPVGDVAQFEVEFEDDVPDNGNVGAGATHEADVFVFASDVFVGDIDGALEHEAVGGDEAVVALVPGEGGIEGAGETAVEKGAQAALF